MKLKDNPKAYAIMGCAMRVHDALGPGFLESAYGDALEIEFANAGIPFVREDEVRVFYNGLPLKTTYRADFTCYDREFIVELKAVKSITKVEWAQVIHYMRATKVKNAFLINFGRGRIQYETFDLDCLPTISSQETSCSVKAEFDAVSSHATIPSQTVSCSVSDELKDRRNAIQRSGSESHTARSFSNRLTGSESATARSFCQQTAAEMITPMAGIPVVAAENLTPMIDAPATAPLADDSFASSSHATIPSQTVSCSVSDELKDRRNAIQRSGSESHTARSFSNRLAGSESATARSFCQQTAAEMITPMAGVSVVAAGNLTPMIDAPATAPQADGRFAGSSHSSIPFKKHSCSVNNEWNVRRKTILRSGSESNTARSFSYRQAGSENVMARSFSNRRTSVEGNTTRSLI